MSGWVVLGLWVAFGVLFALVVGVIDEKRGDQ